MTDIQILHFSDCLISSIKDHTTVVLRDFIRKLSGKYGLNRQINYIVVSGNITADHSEASFKIAADVFAEMAEQLLKRDEQEVRRNRILIVPGKNDIDAENDYTNFKNFHDKFFEKEGDRVEKFDPDKAIFRTLKDLTLIGLCHWTVNAPKYTSKSLKSICKVIEEAKDRILPIDYIKNTPTLLVSANNIVFNSVRADWPVFNKIKAAFEDDFQTTIHLFGASRTTGILPTPLAFHHLGIGTGLRDKGGFWPFNINLMEFKQPDARNEQSGGSFFCTRVYRRFSPEENELLYPWIDGHLDTYFRKDSVAEDQLYKEFLKELEEKLKVKEFIVIKGFPGAGKRKFFEYIQNRDRLDGQKIHIVAITAPNYHDDRRFAAFRKELNLKIKKIKRKALGPDVKVLLLIYDNQLFNLPHGEKGAPFYDFLREIKVNIVNMSVDAVLYLTSNLDFTPITIALGRGDEQPESRTETLMLPRLDDSEVKSLIKKYASSTPVQDNQVRYLAGGYYGFSDLLLHLAEKEFDNFSGAEPLGQNTSTMLVRNALKSPRMRAEAESYFKCLCSISGGNYLQRYIEKKLGAMKSGGEIDLSLLPTVDINVEELKETIKNEVALGGIDKMIKTLIEMELLWKEPGAPAGHYKLRLIAPFLVEDEDLAAAAAINEGASEVTSGDNGKENKKELFPGEEWPPISSEDLRKSADFVIITALNGERDAVLSKLRRMRKVLPTETDSQVYYYSNLPVEREGEGTVGTYRLVVMNLGEMGNVAAGVKVTHAIRRWNPRAVILVGIAGGVSSNWVKIGDILVPTQIGSPVTSKKTEHKEDLRWAAQRIDRTLFNVANAFDIRNCLSLVEAHRPDEGEPEPHYNEVVSSNSVIADKETLEKFGEQFPKITGVEMEAWGAVIAAFEEARPRKFLMIRGVSDLADSQKDTPEVEAWRSYAYDIAASYAIAYLRSGPLPFRRIPGNPAKANEQEAVVNRPAAGPGEVPPGPPSADE